MAKTWDVWNWARESLKGCPRRPNEHRQEEARFIEVIKAKC